MSFEQSDKCRISELTAERDDLSRKLGEATFLLRAVPKWDGMLGHYRDEVNKWLAANAPASEGTNETTERKTDA